jgi:hypothetical protein
LCERVGSGDWEGGSARRVAMCLSVCAVLRAGVFAGCVGAGKGWVDLGGGGGNKEAG